MTFYELETAVLALRPEAWRELLLAVADQQCIACGSDHACECSDDVDAAKNLVAERAVRLSLTKVSSE